MANHVRVFRAAVLSAEEVISARRGGFKPDRR